MRGVRPSDARRRTQAAIRGGLRAAMTAVLAAALSAAPGPARCDEPGARALGSSVLPPLPTPPGKASVPETLSPFLSGATGRPQPAASGSPDIAQAPAGAGGA